MEEGEEEDLRVVEMVASLSADLVLELWRAGEGYWGVGSDARLGASKEEVLELMELVELVERVEEEAGWRMDDILLC